MLFSVIDGIFLKGHFAETVFLASSEEELKHFFNKLPTN